MCLKYTGTFLFWRHTSLNTRTFSHDGTQCSDCQCSGLYNTKCGSTCVLVQCIVANTRVLPHLGKVLEMVSLGLLTRVKPDKHVSQRVSNLRCWNWKIFFLTAFFQIFFNARFLLHISYFNMPYVRTAPVKIWRMWAKISCMLCCHCKYSC